MMLSCPGGQGDAAMCAFDAVCPAGKGAAEWRAGYGCVTEKAIPQNALPIRGLYRRAGERKALRGANVPLFYGGCNASTLLQRP